MRSITRSLVARHKTFFFCIQLLFTCRRILRLFFVIRGEFVLCEKFDTVLRMLSHLNSFINFADIISIRDSDFVSSKNRIYYYQRFNLKWSQVASTKTKYINDFLLRRFHFVDIILNNKPASQWDNRPYALNFSLNVFCTFWLICNRIATNVFPIFYIFHHFLQKQRPLWKFESISKHCENILIGDTN